LLAVAVAVSLVAFSAPVSRAADAPSVDIKHVALPDAYLAVYARHNPQRDYERAYYEDAWKTIQDEQIGPRILSLITSHMPADKLATAKAKLDELGNALAPINFQGLCNAQEVVFSETMQAPFNQVTMAVRLTSTDAADCERGIVQTFQLMGRWSDGKITVESAQVKDATLTTLKLPKQSPYQPAIARVGDIVLTSTDTDLLRRSIEQLQDPDAKSKFDDPRLQEALTHLPKPDDALVFFDGQRLFERLRDIGSFLRMQGGNDDKGQHAAHFFDRIIDATDVVDYTVTVGYTQPGQHRKAELVKMTDNYKSTLLGRVLGNSQPLENWQSWIPADATAFSAHAGINLHELYTGIISMVREEFPGSAEPLDKFAAFQEKIGVDFDRDILQSFSGESVCVTVPIKGADGAVKHGSVWASKCENPDKIRELLTRAVDGLNTIPAVQMQQLKLEDCADLKGFQSIHAAVFQMIGVQPVIGFQDGWMIVGCDHEAVEKVLAVRAGKAESVQGAPRFEKLNINLQGPISAIEFRDIGAGVKRAADIIDKIGAMAPMFVGMAAANAKPEELKPMQDTIALIPSIAKVVRKFDFFGNSLSVTRPGPMPNTFLKESVTEVRLPSGG
ncbi:MAG TPA: hypothetical protein VMJ32_02635, partial [Pirellulales bacterium]|nr:hypothetical protein [Pirellulales bacterium]